MNSSLILPGIFALFAVVSFGMMALMVITEGQTRRSFAERGAVCKGEVTNLYTGRAWGFLWYSTTYFMGYTYFVPDDSRRYSGNCRVFEGAYRRLKAGDAVDIRYLPDKHEVSRPTTEYIDENAIRGEAWGCFAPAVVMLVFAVLTFVTASTETQSSASSKAADTQTQKDIVEIHTALDSRLLGWQKASSAQITRLSATDAGFGSSSDFLEIFYATRLCTTRGATPPATRAPQFFVIAINRMLPPKQGDATWMALGYVYTSGQGNVNDCLPEGWTLTMSTTLGGGWSSMFIIYPPQIPFFALTATARAK